MGDKIAYKGLDRKTLSLSDWPKSPNFYVFLPTEQALGLDPKDDDYVLNVVGIFGGFYILFFTERVLQIVLKADAEVRACTCGYYSLEQIELFSCLTQWFTSTADGTQSFSSLAVS